MTGAQAEHERKIPKKQKINVVNSVNLYYNECSDGLILISN